MGVVSPRGESWEVARPITTARLKMEDVHMLLCLAIHSLNTLEKSEEVLYVAKLVIIHKSIQPKTRWKKMKDLRILLPTIWLPPKTCSRILVDLFFILKSGKFKTIFFTKTFWMCRNHMFQVKNKCADSLRKKRLILKALYTHEYASYKKWGYYT
jgi:hypothetical protein